MKKYIYSMAIAATFFSAASCSDEVVNGEVPVTPEGQKEMIRFSMSDEAGSANSGGMTRAGFETSTQIIARFESVKTTTIGGTTTTDVKRSTRTVMTAQPHSNHDDKYSDVTTSDPRYWDDCFGRYANLSVYAVAVPGQTDVTNGSTTSTTLANLVSYGGDKVSTTNTVWKVEGSSTSNNNIVWEVTKGARTVGTSISGQTSETIGKEDLTYSNNIQSSGENGVYRWDYNASTPDYPSFSENYSTLTNGVLRFAIPVGAAESAPGHFDKGHMIFKHALTRLTINLKRGTGFASGSGYFQFKKEGSTNATNVKIIKVPVKNTLNIQTGEWSTTSTDITSADIEMIEKLSTVKASFDYSLRSQFIPGYTFNSTGADASKNVLEFTIDDNTYYVTQQMIWKALNDKANDTTSPNGLDKTATSYTMEQGKNYILDITVNKTEIKDVTATLVGWGEVAANPIDANNSYISITSATMGAQTEKCDHFALYRLDAKVNDIYANQDGTSVPEMKNWGGNYDESPATLTKDASYGSNGIWKTNWYWDSNKSFYHFRSVDKTVSLYETGSDTDDYFKVFSGPVNDTWSTTQDEVSTQVNDKKYNDYHWGAPMKTGATLTYNATSGDNAGYSESLYQAIGSTTNQINMIEQHMMSTVHFIIHTGRKADGTVTGGAVTLMDASNNGTRLTLTNFAGEAQVKMGNGFITPSTSKISSDIPVPGATITYGTGDNANTLSTLVTTSSDYYETVNEKTKSYDYRVVPQPLYHGTSTATTDETLSNFVGLTIVTPDNNQYYVIKKLYGVEGTITNNGNKNEHNATSGKAPIYRWYPGYDYTYHIYINKTGIESITCTVVDWVKVEGNVGDINLEN